MVPTGKHVQEVYVGKEMSVLSALESLSEDQRAATLCIDQSTIEQSISKAIALQLKEAGANFVDAPVSGGQLIPQYAGAIINLSFYRCRRCREGHIGNNGRGKSALLR